MEQATVFTWDTTLAAALISAIVSFLVVWITKRLDYQDKRAAASGFLQLVSWEFQEYKLLTASPVAIQLDASTLLRFFLNGHHLRDSICPIITAIKSLENHLQRAQGCLIGFIFHLLVHVQDGFD